MAAPHLPNDSCFQPGLHPLYDASVAEDSPDMVVVGMIDGSQI